MTQPTAVRDHKATPIEECPQFQNRTNSSNDLCAECNLTIDLLGERDRPDNLTKATVCIAKPHPGHPSADDDDYLRTTHLCARCYRREYGTE